jgi:hypothetical protein
LKAVYIIAAVLLAASCNNAELENCQHEVVSLKHEMLVRDSVMNSISSSYAEIDSNSKIISAKKEYINEIARKGKLTPEDKEIILSELDTINMLMSKNRDKVSTLQGRLSDESLQVGFKSMLESMDEKNVIEHVKLDDMKKELIQVSHDFSDLFEDYVYKEVENMEMKEKLTSATKELQEAQEKLYQAKEKLQSAYYVIGTKDELEAKGLIFKKGFFDSKEVNEDFDRSQFKKVDINELKEILLDARSAEILTTHPTEAYETVGIKKKVNKLVITNPELFWSVSKFLIIEIEH